MAERVRSSIASIFIGPDGLRAGWRFLLFALAIEVGVFVIEEPLAQVLARLFAINLRELSAPALLIREFVFCLSVFLVTGIFALAERRRIDSYGLPIEQALGKFFWKGMLAGLLVVLFVTGAMILSGAMVLHGLALVHRKHSHRSCRRVHLSWLRVTVALAWCRFLAGGFDYDSNLRRRSFGKARRERN